MSWPQQPEATRGGSVVVTLWAHQEGEREERCVGDVTPTSAVASLSPLSVGRSGPERVRPRAPPSLSRST